MTRQPPPEPMDSRTGPWYLPRYIWALLAIYGAASFTHFAHNAEYIAFYPNMPRWVTREDVYIAWLIVNIVGLAGIALARFGWRSTGAACLAAYGALGLYGLGHYTLALCSEHTFTMNLTIWFEVVAGAALAAGSVALLLRGRADALRLSRAS